MTVDLRAHDLKAASAVVWRDVDNLRSACMAARMLLICLSEERRFEPGEFGHSYKVEERERAEQALKSALVRANMGLTGS